MARHTHAHVQILDLLYHFHRLHFTVASRTLQPGEDMGLVNESHVIRQTVHPDPVHRAPFLPVRDEKLDFGIFLADDRVTEHALFKRWNRGGGLSFDAAVTEFTRYSKLTGMTRVVERDRLLRRGAKRPAPCPQEYQQRSGRQRPAAQHDSDSAQYQ